MVRRESGGGAGAVSELWLLMGGPGQADEWFSFEYVDPVPESALKRAREAFSQRSSRPVARLVSDSLVEHSDPAGAHVLRFETAEYTVVLHVAAGLSGATLDGTIGGSTAHEADKAVLQLEGSDLALVAPVEDCRFRFGPLAHGIVAVMLEADVGPLLRTDWFQV